MGDFDLPDLSQDLKNTNPKSSGFEVPDLSKDLKHQDVSLDEKPQNTNESNFEIPDIQSDLKSAPKTAEEQKPTTQQSYFLNQVANKKPEQLENIDIQFLNSLSPDALHDVAMARKDIPLTDDQLRKVYDYHKEKSVTDPNYGTPSSLREFMDMTNRWVEPLGKVGNEIAHTLWSAAKGAGKLGYATADYVTTPDMRDPEVRKYYTPQQVEEFRAAHKKKGENLERAWQSFSEPVVGLPEELTYFGTKLGAGGFDWYDRASEALGFQDHEKSFQHFKARRAVDSAQAQYYMEHPSAYGRLLDLPIVKGGLEAVVKSQMPSADEWMSSHPDITKEQAQAQLNEIAKSHVDSQIKESESRIAESDPDIVTAGTFLQPSGLGMGEMGALGMGARAVSELTPKITKGLKYLGKTDAEINAMNAAAQALGKQQEAQKFAATAQPSILEKGAGKIAQGIDWATAFGKGITEKIPAGARPFVPYVAGGAAGGIYGHEQGRSVIGDVIHGIEIAGLLKAPALVRDISEARRISAGGTKGTFETMAGFPNVSEGAAKIIRFGGKNVDRLLDNAAEYAKAGIHGTALAVATGALDSADSDTMNELVSNGLIYSLGGHAFERIKGKFTGFDPILEKRKRAQQDVDNLKTYADLSPETKQTLNDITDWNNVVQSQQQKTTEAFTAYQDASARGAKNAEELGKEYQAQQKALSSVMRANVQTRNEYGRLFIDQISRNNQLVNGSLRAGQNNVGINVLTTQQIFDQFRKDPANAGKSDAEVMEAANQRGFYSTPDGAIEYRSGMGMEAPKKDLVFDRTKPSVVVNADHLKARSMMFGESLTETLNHEIGHHVSNIPEFRDANKDAEAMLFSQEIKDPSGNVVTLTSGRYSPKDLVEMYTKNYMKNKSAKQIEDLSKLAGLWDYSRQALDENAVASYMRDEILADLNAGTISRHLGKDLDSGTQHLLDVASIKTKKNLLDKAIQKFAGLGGRGEATSQLTGAKFSPEVLAANRQAVRALQSLQGEVSPAVAAPETPKISRAEMMKNRSLQNRYGKDSGLFKTKVQAQIFDGNGNPIGAPIDIANPNAAEGTWQNKDGQIRQSSGYGQRPDEVSEVNGVQIPEGGSLVVGKQIVTQPDGVTPVLLTPKEAKQLQKDRGKVVRDALNTPDEGAPNRFEPTGDPDGTWRGRLTPLQIEAIKNLPESIVPKSIKERILSINDWIKRGDGSRMLVDYAAVMNDNGKYTPYSAKIYDVVPIGMHLSKDGHFLVTTISVGRMFDKLNKWSERMPARLSPWNGSKEAFFKEFTEKYLQNWQNGLAGETGLAGTPEEALAKKNIFNDFLNLTTKDTAPLNPDRTKTPRRRGDVRGKDIDRTIMSMRLDHMAELIDNEGAPKVPVDYGKAIKNFMPAEIPAEQPVSREEERKPSAIDLGITAARTPESRPFGAQYVPQAQAPTPKSDLFFMPASAEIREEGSKQHLEFWNRELENSGIKEKPTTMEALEKFIYKQTGKTYASENLLYQGRLGESVPKLFPTPNAEKIKAYYSNVVRNATPEQAINFPENWRRVRNMSDEEFNNFFSQDRVEKITKSRVETLSKSADYLLGEMQEPEIKKYITENEPKIKDLQEKLKITTDQKQRDEIYYSIDFYEKQIEKAKRQLGSYTPAEVAAILDASAKVRVRTGKDENGNMIPVKQKITNGNEVVPNEVSGATASRIAEYMRQGMGSEEAYTKGVFDTMKARAEQRGTYTGWKKYDQSDDMGEAEKLNADVSGTNWCTGGAVSTAHGHLSGGDFYVYFDEGEPQVAIRTDDGQIAEVRGRGDGQNITTPAYDQAAEEFIRSGEGPEGGDKYLHDREFRKLAVEIIKTGKIPEAAMKYYDQYGNFSAPTPKMSYRNKFEPEYLEAFESTRDFEEPVFDEKTGTLKTNLTYDPDDSSNDKYIHINGGINLPKSYSDDDFSPKGLKNLKSIDGEIRWHEVQSPVIFPALERASHIDVGKAVEVEFPSLVESGSIDAYDARSFIAPELKKSLHITYRPSGYSKQDLVFEVPKLEESGDIFTRHLDTLNLPSLKKASAINGEFARNLIAPKLVSCDRLDLVNMSYIPKFERTQKTYLFGGKYVYEIVAKPDILESVLRVNDGQCYTTDSDSGKHYFTENVSQARELSEAFNEIYWKKQNNLTIEEAKTILDKYEIKPLMPVEGDRGLRIISAKVRFGQNASTEFASNHIDAMSQIFGDKYDKNYNTRRSRENDSFGYEVSSPNGNFMVDRRTAYSIAKENGQLREPETLDQKVDYDRGVLHSDMVNYEGEKSGISFMPKSEEEQPEQKISSAGTSLRQVPAVFKAIPWKKGTLNADLGGGKYDEFTNALQTQGVENVIYDPYNRSAEHNQAAMDRIAGNADTATISNVLNVIAEPAARDQVIRQAADAIKPEGEAYFSVYIGDGSGKGKETPRGYQLNRKLADYIEEIERHFGSVTKKGNILIAKEPVKSGASDISFMPSAGESQKVPTQEELDAMKERLPAYKSELEQHAEGRFTIHLYNEDNSKYVGIAEGQIRGNEPNKVYIYDSEVKPQFKKQGYGEALYRELAKYAQDNGATTLWGNPASEEAVAVRNKLFKTSTGIQNTAIGGYGYASSKVPRDISFMPAAGESQKVPTQEELDAMKARLPKYKVKNKSYDENSTPDDEFYGEGYDEIYIYSPDEKYLIGKAVVENNGYGVVSVINTEVMKGYRGKGFGEALYREMAKYAQSVGANTLYGYPISESAMKVRKKLFDTDESTSKVPSDISFMPADEEYTNEQKTRNDLVRKYDDLIKSQSSKGSSVVYHQPPEKDANGDVISNELWVVSSPKNERESIITKNDDGLFDVSKGEDGMFYDHKTLEDAMIQARHYVESAPSSDQNNLQRDARSEIMEEIHIPSDMVLKEVRDTANDSIYYRVDHILSRDEEGNPDDVETYKISIRNHDPSPFRELEFGKNDYWVEVPKNPSPKDMADAVSKVEKWLENQSDISFMPASKLDEAHAKAIESGDTEEAQRLIDEAARKAGYTIGPVWHHGGFDKDVHGIPNTEKGMHFGTKEAATQRAYQKGHDDQIESLKVEQDPETGKWHWSTTDYDSWDSNEEGFNTESQARRDADDAMDAMYSSDSWLDVQPEDLGTFTKAYLKGNFKKIADVGSGWADEIEKAKKQGYDGFVYKNDVEDIGSTSYSIFNPEQAKSADPATYDEQGNLIPLSQRFDTSKRDIRFMPKSEEKSLSRDYSEYETDEDYERPKADEFLSAKTIASINKVISKIEKTLPAHSITEKTTKKGYSVLSITPEGAKKPIGTALVGLENNEVQLEDIEVDDDYRGKRYGRALMLGAVKWGLEKGATRMYADNVVSNTEPPWMGIFGSWRMESVDEGAGAWADFTEIPKNLVSKKSGDISFIPYSPELPKTEDGKVDWEGFKTKTQETAKPLAGLSFSPSGKEQDYDFMHEAGVALPKKVPARGYFNIGVSTPDGRVLVYKLDPKRAVMPQIKGLDTISGEYVHILQADRHDTTGDNMGGPMHPYLISNQVTAVGPDGIEYKPVWANMTAGLVTRAKNRVMETQNGYALVYAMDENAHKSNRKLVGDYMKEVDDLIKANGLTAEQIEATHVLLELGKWQDDRTEAQLKYRKAVEKAEANKTKPPKPLKDTPTDKAIMRLNADLSPLKSHMTSGNPDRISKAQTEIVKILKKHSQQDWYKDLAKKTAGLTFANEMKSFSFTARALAMDKIAGVPFLPSLHKLLRATEDFKNAQNSDVVGVVQLSKNRDVFAIYLGNDPKQEAKMSKSERAIRDQFLKDPNFRIHPSYDWMMLGPANGNNFIVASPKKLRDIFPDYENQHSKLKLKPKHKITDALVAGSMNLSAEPKIQIP